MMKMGAGVLEIFRVDAKLRVLTGLKSISDRDVCFPDYE